MPSVRYRTFLISLLVISSLLAFLAVSIYALYQTIVQSEAPLFNEQLVYVANILTGLVGGIVAVGFGQSPPAPTGETDKNKLGRNAQGIGQLLSALGHGAQGFMGFIYGLAYIVVSLAAIVIWVTDSNAPELVKNLSTVALGTFVPVVGAYFKENT